MPIMALSLRGVLISPKPWKQAHLKWFQEMAKKLDDPSILDDLGTNYFEKIDEVMSRLHPSLSQSEREIKARESYWELVCDIIRETPNAVDRTLVDFFLSLKPKYEIVLITSMTSRVAKQVLASASLLHVFDKIYASFQEEKENKKAVLNRFLEENGKPSIYFGSNSEDTVVYCEENNIPHLFIEEGQEPNHELILNDLRRILEND